MKKSWATILCVFALALSGLTSPTVTAAPSRRVLLRGVNTIVGDQTGYVPVRLEERVVLDFSAFAASREGFGRLFREGGPTPAVDVAGGRFAGFMLTDASVGESGPVVMAGTFRNCDGRCRSGEILNFSYPISLEAKMILDPGDYRLFLITSGGPTRVTFRFERGPVGSLKLRPETPTHAGASSWLAANDLERTAHSGTTAHETFSDAFALSLMVVDGPYTAEGMGVCINESTSPTAEHCNPRGGNTLSRINAEQVGGREPQFVLATVRLDVTAGDWRLGGWYAHPTPPDLLSVMTLTADYGSGSG